MIDFLNIDIYVPWPRMYKFAKIGVLHTRFQFVTEEIHGRSLSLTLKNHVSI
jgi:hypothetical protein